MKFLTLNSHSWMEENAQQKFETLKEQILEAQYDVIFSKRSIKKWPQKQSKQMSIIKPCRHL